MNNICDFSQTRRSRLVEAVLWASAAVMTLSVHAGAAIYLMQTVEPALGDEGPPPAIMIEMAALPEAVNTEDTTQSNDAVDSVETLSDTVEPVEEPPPPEPIIEEVKPPEPEPIQEVVEPEPVEDIDPIENEMLAALENVAVPLPVLRPPPPPKEEKKVVEQKKPEKKKLEQPKPKPPASKATETAKANAAQSNRSVSNAAGASSGASPAEVAKYDARVRAAIARRKPRNLRASAGVATVRFNVTSSGTFSGVSLVKSSGDGAVDQRIIAWVSGVKAPPPPPGAKTSYTLPIKIN